MHCGFGCRRASLPGSTLPKWSPCFSARGLLIVAPYNAAKRPLLSDDRLPPHHRTLPVVGGVGGPCKPLRRHRSVADGLFLARSFATGVANALLKLGHVLQWDGSIWLHASFKRDGASKHAPCTTVTDRKMKGILRPKNLVTGN